MSEQNLKVVILGEGRVGKTSILSRYFNNKFNENEESTNNPSFYEKKVERNGQKYKFCFWDTAGQERYNALNAIYYNGAIGALIVYDVNNFETFDKVKKWVTELQEMIGPDTIFVIAGNKFDKVSSREELNKNKPVLEAYLQEQKVKHFYTSAKSGDNINDTFECLINLILDRQKGDKKGKRGGLQISEEKSKEPKKGGCC